MSFLTTLIVNKYTFWLHQESVSYKKIQKSLWTVFFCVCVCVRVRACALFCTSQTCLNPGSAKEHSLESEFPSPNLASGLSEMCWVYLVSVTCVWCVGSHIVRLTWTGTEQRKDAHTENAKENFLYLEEALFAKPGICHDCASLCRTSRSQGKYAYLSDTLFIIYPQLFHQSIVTTKLFTKTISFSISNSSYNKPKIEI